MARDTLIDVGDGHMPAIVLGEGATDLPAAVVIPSIFGPADDLVKRLATVAHHGLIVVTDPFWRVGPGPVAYEDFPGALAKVEALDRARCIEDIQRVAAAVRGKSNGRVVGLGICFGGPFCLMGAAEGWFDSVVTWHGSRMQNYLDRAAEITAPMALHFGGADQLVSPEVVAQVRQAFATHDNVQVVVHDGCGHGYSHLGAAWNEPAADAGLDALANALALLSSRTP